MNYVKIQISNHCCPEKRILIGSDVLKLCLFQLYIINSLVIIYKKDIFKELCIHNYWGYAIAYGRLRPLPPAQITFEHYKLRTEKCYESKSTEYLPGHQPCTKLWTHIMLWFFFNYIQWIVCLFYIIFFNELCIHNHWCYAIAYGRLRPLYYIRDHPTTKISTRTK